MDLGFSKGGPRGGGLTVMRGHMAMSRGRVREGVYSLLHKQWKLLPLYNPLQPTLAMLVHVFVAS